MLVDRHHVQYLIELGELAREASAGVLAGSKDRVEVFLGTLGGAATPTAVLAFAARMAGLPAEGRPWSAVRVSEPDSRLAPGTGTATSGPPAAMLVRGHSDDDPDGEEDGNRIPDSTAWAPLPEALERWDTQVILAWIGPLGWQPPTTSLLLEQAPELSAGSMATGSPPGPTSPGQAASLAAQEADARSRKALRTIGTVAAAGGAGGLLFGLGRALGRAATQPRIDSAKEPTS